MANVLFAVRRSDELVGRFYSNSEAELSFNEKLLVCDHLGFVLDDGMVFQVAGLSGPDALIGRKPDFTTEGTNRTFWIYQEGEALPA